MYISFDFFLNLAETRIIINLKRLRLVVLILTCCRILGPHISALLMSHGHCMAAIVTYILIKSVKEEDQLLHHRVHEGQRFTEADPLIKEADMLAVPLLSDKVGWRIGDGTGKA